jgi:hypothetical protein
MLLHPGDKLHIITRRLYENDLRRHFAGEVQNVTENAVRLKGYTFVFDGISNDFKRREDVRVRLFSLMDAGLIINLLPAEAIIENITYELSAENHLLVTDGKYFTMDLREFY